MNAPRLWDRYCLEIISKGSREEEEERIGVAGPRLIEPRTVFLVTPSAFK